MTRPAFKPVKPRQYDSPKACIAELFAERGGVENVMVLLGLGRTTTYAFADPREAEEISFARVAALTVPDAPAAAEYLARRAGGVFLPVIPEEADLAALCADDMRAHGEALAGVVATLSAPATGEQLQGELAKIDSALRTLAGLRAVASHALKPKVPSSGK
jgi:hypothetical protein